jgi:organic radical activating enzyme
LSAGTTASARLTLAEVRALRATWGKSALLFLTDRCPVGCAHCSVDSRADSPSISDWPLFERLLTGLAALPDLALVGISGGEPFVERRGLTRAMEVLTGAGKRIALYTSGVWARPTVPTWVPPILRTADAVFLSTDAYHQAAVERAQFAAAARACAEAGASLIVPVLAQTEEIARAAGLLEEALGPNWGQQAELMHNPPLPLGRGAGVFAPGPMRTAASFGACTLARSPVVRYDGRVTGCCNEAVIMGHGPPALAAEVRDGTGLASALAGFQRHPLHRLIASVGVGTLADSPRFAPLRSGSYASICDACWRLHDALAADERADSVLALLGRLLSSHGTPHSPHRPEASNAGEAHLPHTKQ